MSYAIIKSDFLKVVRLTDWQDYEWDDFNTVRDVENDEILWFLDESGAVEFMFENFDEKLIDIKYFKNYSKDYKFYFR